MTDGKLLGIDHGILRIGLAVSDASRLVARELTVIKRTSLQEDFAKLNRIAAQERVVGIVVGLPSNLDAWRAEDRTTQGDAVRRWTEKLAATTSLPIVFWDEQMSSAEALDMARERRRKPDQPIDDLAARVILQRYLDALRDGMAEEPEKNPINPSGDQR